MKTKLEMPPRFQLAMVPTPLETLFIAPSSESGVEIFIKRDDLTGSELSGNKIRKLEFIFYDAVSCRSDIILTCGGVGSNHCRAVAAIAARIGIDCELTLMGKPPAIPDGNLLLNSLYKTKTRYITVSEYEKNIDNILTKRANTLIKRGRNPYIIPEGASNPLGVWGYFLAGLELKKQLDTAGIKADYITCAVGSGGTYTGLLAASLYLKWPVKIIGFAVNRNSAYFTDKITDLIERFIRTYKVNLSFKQSAIIIDDGYIGPGYAKISNKEALFIKKIAANTGIILDPAYTSKSMLGLFDYIKKGKVNPNSNVVFIHTGGLLSIFPYRKILT